MIPVHRQLVLTLAIIRKAKQVNTTYSKFTWVGLLASAVVVTSLVGCDTTSPDSETPPPAEQGEFKKGLKGMRISKKEGASQEAPKQQPPKK
jgi:hypothetical protein